ncbi:ankyrin repeat-containing domain protein [Ustulina deusta]|nr:ankyrin repeat-containing domain protein [Ustulina deusta]
MSNPPLISPGSSFSTPNLTTIEGTGLKTEKESGDAYGNQGSLHVAWGSTPHPSPAIRIEDPDGIPKPSVSIDAVVVFGLFDEPQSPQAPMEWLCDYLDQPEGDPRILHFNYHPSQVLAPGHSHYGIEMLSELLLCQLTKLRADGTSRRIIFFAFDIGCIIVKKALTLASQAKSPHGEIFDACRTLVFFDCPHRSANTLDMEDKLARLLYGRAENSSSHIRPNIAALSGLATSILETNESFIASKFLVRSYLVSVHEDAMLGFQAWQMLEHHMGALGTPFEWRMFCHRFNDLFVSDLLQVLRALEHLPGLAKEASIDTQFPRLPFDGERALLSLATPTEPFIVAGHIVAYIKLCSVYLQWLDFCGTQVLYVYSSKDKNDLVRRTSEHVFAQLMDLQPSGHKVPVLLYYSFDAADIRSRSLSSMIWTFLTHITSRFREIRHFVPFILDRLYEEQACTEIDLLGWFDFFISRFDDIYLVINHFDVCPKPSRDVFMQLVARIAMSNDRPLKVFLTSREPARLQAELPEWPSIDLDMDIDFLHKEKSVELKDDTEEPKPNLVSEPPPALPIQETLQPPLTLSEGTEVVDALAMSILLEQQLKRNLTTQEIMQEANHGTLETYTLEAVLDRVFRSIPDQKQVRLAVAFLLLATRPLSTKEFATVMFLGSFVDNGESVLPPWDIFDRLERQRTTWFAGITVNKHSGVHLAHPRVEDVLRNPETSGSPRYFWHEVASTAHYDIANICLSYLTRSQVKEEQDLLSEKSFLVDGDLGFISYAVKFWPYHFSLAQVTTEKEAIESIRKKMADVDLERWSRTVWLLSNPFSRSRNPWKSPIPALISLGHSNILQPSSTSDITSGVEEAARTGDANLANSLLGAEGGDNLPQSALLETIMAAGSSGNESLTIELIDRLSFEGRDELSKRGETLLFRAARLGLARLAGKLLEIGTPVDPEISYSKDTLTTPLCVATVAGYALTVEVLLNYGANVEFRSHLQRTPLSLAAAQGNADVIECLVRQGKADIQHVYDGNDARKQTPLFIACEWGNPLVVEKLIELGVDPSKPDDRGWSPIIVAASFGHWRAIQTLLDHGVDIEMAGPEGHGTALRYALAGGQINVFRRLLEKGANPSSPLFLAPLLYEIADSGVLRSDGDRIALAKLLLEQHKVDINATTRKRRRTALVRASANAPSGLAEFLLGYNPDVNLADKGGYTALFEATAAPNLPLVKLLLDKGADANMLTSKGNIPLHMCGYPPELTRLLAERTKNIDLPMTGGLTQLMVAASKRWTESVKVLLEHKANVNAVATSEIQWAGWTAIMFAAFHHFADIILILAEKGADLKKADANGASALHLIFELPTTEGKDEFGCLCVLMEFQTRIDVDQVGGEGETVLHRCAQLGHLRAVQRLVRAGASLNLQDNSGSTPLGQATWSNRRDVISYLLKQGADPNTAGRDLGHKEGPLHRACRDSDYATAKMLIDHGADVNCDSVSGFGTPLMAVCLPYSKYLGDTDKLTQHLLELDIDVNAKSRYVGSPLAAAALSSRPNIVRALLDKGAVYDREDDLKRRPIHFAAINGEENFRIIEEVGGKVAEVDILCRSVLHYAAQGGRLRVVKRIFELLPELDVDTRDIDGWTPLCWVARGTTSWVSEDRASEPTDPVGVVRYLLDRGADRSVKCKIGDEIWTPLQVARYTGAPDEVLDLLKQRPEPELQGNDAGELAEDKDDLDQRKGTVREGITCDACLWEIRGVYHQCKVCCDYALCPKCLPHRDLVHVFESPHNLEAVDPDSDNASRTSKEGPEDEAPSVALIPSVSRTEGNDDVEDKTSVRNAAEDEGE